MFSFFDVTEVKFRIVLYPLEVGGNNLGKGQGSFKSSKGAGKIRLKCDTSVSDINVPPELADDPAKKETFLQSRFSLAFRFFVASDLRCRGPVRNDFTKVSTAGLPKEIEDWNFLKHVERGNLMVGVEAIGGVQEELPAEWEQISTDGVPVG